MPIYMDVHIIPGVKARDVAEAHKLDLGVQDEHACKCMTYWIDEERESIFCLIEAPTKEAVEEMHNKAHGLIPNKVIEVSTSLVETFLGRIYDPADAEITEDGLKIFSDSAYRVIMVIKTEDPVLLQHSLGADVANALLQRYNLIVKRNLAKCGGSEVEHSGIGTIISFHSASKAISCASAIQNDLHKEDIDLLKLRIGINGGEPVEKSNKLFGDTIKTATLLCHLSGKNAPVVASCVYELIAKDQFKTSSTHIRAITPNDESVLALLYQKLEENLQNPDFNVDEYCQAMAMSKSQLYRKTIDLFDLSPNSLLKDFRLEKAKELLRKQRSNISQITFDTGFTSPSYFTKCFKKKYGLLPMAYLEMVGSRQ